MTHVVELPSTKERHHRTRSQWFGQYLTNQVRSVSDYYIARFGIGNKTELVETPTTPVRVKEIEK